MTAYITEINQKSIPGNKEVNYVIPEHTCEKCGTVNKEEFFQYISYFIFRNHISRRGSWIYFLLLTINFSSFSFFFHTLFSFIIFFRLEFVKSINFSENNFVKCATRFFDQNMLIRCSLSSFSFQKR